MKKSSVDKDWECLFAKYDILNNIDKRGLFRISAKQIQLFHEPRLMVKHDHSINRPSIFRKNGLSILPVTRGDYVIGRMDLYKSFREGQELLFTDTDVITVSQPHIESIDFKQISSEAIAINSMYVSGILHHFLDEASLFPTISGRMGSGCFRFDVNQVGVNNVPYHINITNSQIEIDGGFEGDDSLCIIEAKNSLSEDFLIRQLYYPYRVWKGRVTKQIRPVFLCYSNGIYHLMEYSFGELENYSSISLVKYKRYQIAEANIPVSVDTLLGILRKAKRVEEPNVPFPQANSMLRIIDLCEQLAKSELSFGSESLSKSRIAEIYGFAPRQSDYYANAGIYLGLIRKSGSAKYELSEEGKKIFAPKVNKQARNLKIASLVFQHEVFRKCFTQYIAKAAPLSNEEYMRIMREVPLYNMTESLIPRRASTVINWINWILGLQTD